MKLGPMFYISRRFGNSTSGCCKFLARPTSLCRRAESIVSLERGGLLKCRIASIFFLQKLKGSMSGDARDFINMETRAVISFFPLARQDAEGNSCHSGRNIRGTCTIVCHRQKTSWPSLNVVIFPPMMRLVLDDPKQ